MLAPRGKLTERRADGYAGVADAGQAAHLVWIDGDSLLGHGPRLPRRPPITAAGGSMQGGIAVNRHASGPFQALMRISAWNNGDMRGWFHLVSGFQRRTQPARVQGHSRKSG